MSLPIGVYGLLVGLFGLVAIDSGAWLVFHARDVVKLAGTPKSDVVAGRARRPPASCEKTRAFLIVNILSTIAALSVFALIATGEIDSDETRMDPYAQRP